MPNDEWVKGESILRKDDNLVTHYISKLGDDEHTDCIAVWTRKKDRDFILACLQNREAVERLLSVSSLIGDHLGLIKNLENLVCKVQY